MSSRNVFLVGSLLSTLPFQRQVLRWNRPSAFASFPHTTWRESIEGQPSVVLAVNRFGVHHTRVGHAIDTGYGCTFSPKSTVTISHGDFLFRGGNDFLQVSPPLNAVIRNCFTERLRVHQKNPSKAPCGRLNIRLPRQSFCVPQADAALFVNGFCAWQMEWASWRILAALVCQPSPPSFLKEEMPIIRTIELPAPAYYYLSSRRDTQLSCLDLQSTESLRILDEAKKAESENRIHCSFVGVDPMFNEAQPFLDHDHRQSYEEVFLAPDGDVNVILRLPTANNKE